MYSFWQFLHVVFAVAWVGGSMLFMFLSFRFAAARDNPIAGPAGGLVAQTGVPLFMVASLGTFVTGLILAFGWIGFGPLWIKIGLAGVIVSLAMGWGYHRPHGAKIAKAMEEGGPGNPTAQALVRQGNIVGLIETAILLGVIWAMVTKPN